MTSDEQRAVAQVTVRLQDEYSTVPAETIAEVVASIHGKFSRVRARSLVPSLVEQFTRSVLLARTA